MNQAEFEAHQEFHQNELAVDAAIVCPECHVIVPTQWETTDHGMYGFNVCPRCDIEVSDYD